MSRYVALALHGHHSHNGSLCEREPYAYSTCSTSVVSAAVLIFHDDQKHFTEQYRQRWTNYHAVYFSLCGVSRHRTPGPAVVPAGAAQKSASIIAAGGADSKPELSVIGIYSACRWVMFSTPLTYTGDQPHCHQVRAPVCGPAAALISTVEWSAAHWSTSWRTTCTRSGSVWVPRCRGSSKASQR